MSKKELRSSAKPRRGVLRMARGNCNFSTVHSQLSVHRFHACMRICAREATKGAPLYEQKELRSSAKPRRGEFANGAGEL